MAFKRIRKYLDLVMAEHTIFSLPFVWLSAELASDTLFRGFPPDPWKIHWITLALLGARNGANALNRIFDKDLDAANPRTSGRHIPQGTVTNAQAWKFAILCFLLLIFSACMLNWLCIVLLPAALVIFALYSFTKRITWFCHFFLGIISGGAVVGAWIGIKAAVLDWQMLILAAGYAAWVAGFDMIYGCQDEKFDRETGLHSAAVKFGINGALGASWLTHGFAVLCFLGFGLIMSYGILYFAGLAAIAGLLIWEHLVVKPDKLEHIVFASYTMNQIISPVFFLFVTADLIIRRLT